LATRKRLSSSSFSHHSPTELEAQIKQSTKMRTLRFQLNTFFSGPQAWLFLAEDRGYLRDAGVQIEWIEGDTAANTIPQMASGGTDLGYGDLNALIEHHALGSKNLPMAIFASYNATPYTIAVPASSAITQPQHLAGKRIASHPNDAALRLLSEFCMATGIEQDQLQVVECSDPHHAMIPQLLAGQWDAMLGFVNTLAAACIDADLQPTQLRHFAYADYAPDLYGMALLASTPLIRDEPELLRATLAAFNQGLQDTVRQPQDAIDALMRRRPHIHREANLQRLLGTLALEMGQAEGAHLGIGQIDDERLKRSIDLIQRAKNYARMPSCAELFTRDFLPPSHALIRSLAKHCA
jgi:NitT/TauT family transport system substrate-binding protein